MSTRVKKTDSREKLLSTKQVKIKAVRISKVGRPMVAKRTYKRNCRAIIVKRAVRNPVPGEKSGKKGGKGGRNN